MIRKKLDIEIDADFFAPEDEMIYHKSIQELRNGETIDLDRAKKELLDSINRQNGD